MLNIINFTVRCIYRHRMCEKLFWYNHLHHEKWDLLSFWYSWQVIWRQWIWKGPNLELKLNWLMIQVWFAMKAKYLKSLPRNKNSKIWNCRIQRKSKYQWWSFCMYLSRNVFFQQLGHYQLSKVQFLNFSRKKLDRFIYFYGCCEWVWSNWWNWAQYSSEWETWSDCFCVSLKLLSLFSNY